MTTRTPTPQGISRLLAAAGFKRSERDRLSTSGFEVSRFGTLGGEVVVRWRSLSMGASEAAHTARLEEYAKAITDAGYAVKRDERMRRLIVTAKTEEA